MDNSEISNNNINIDEADTPSEKKFNFLKKQNESLREELK